MKLKRGLIFNPDFSEALVKLSKLDLDVDVSVSLYKSLKTLGEETKITHEVKNSIMESFGVKSFGPSGVELADENKTDFSAKEFVAKMNELLDQEIEIPLKKKIVLPKDTKISANAIVLLENILEFDDDKGE